MPRTNLRDALPDIANAKIVARNTFAYMRLDGTKVFRLHYTDIVEILPDGRVKLRSGGFKTVTTKDRLNRFAPGLSIYSIRGTWYVRSTDRELACPFFDGMILPDAFDKPSKIPEKEAKLKASIKKFVCDTIPAKGELPKPDNGDCWFCLMIDAEPPVTRESNGHTVHDPRPKRNNDHLIEHIRQKYMTGSLIVNALRANGIADKGIGYYLSGFMGDNKRVRSMVQKYLGKRLGLAV